MFTVKKKLTQAKREVKVKRADNNGDQKFHQFSVFELGISIKLRDILSSVAKSN